MTPSGRPPRRAARGTYGRLVLQIESWAHIPNKISNARTFRHNNLVVLQQPTGAVEPSHPQLAQWVAVGNPTLVGRLATARVLLGRNADPHLAEWRRVVALTAAPVNE